MPETIQDWRVLPAGRELDAIVAERVMGWTVAHYVRIPFTAGFERRVGYSAQHINYYETADGQNPAGRKLSDLTHGWSPSTDIVAAWEVVAAMHDRVSAHSYGPPDTREPWPHANYLTLSVVDGLGGAAASFCCVTDDNEWYERASEYGGARAESAPLAICRAALSAMEAVHG